MLLRGVLALLFTIFLSGGFARLAEMRFEAYLPILSPEYSL